MSDLIIPTNLPGLTLTTANGETLNITDHQVADLIPVPRTDNQPIWALKVGQFGDARREFREKLFITRNKRENVGGTWTSTPEQIGPLASAGEVLQGWPLGYRFTRSLMPDFGSGDNQPLCHSETYFAPDAQFAGKYATSCCQMTSDPYRPLQITCPMAQWKNGANGKGIPPACSEQVVIWFLVQVTTPEGPQAIVVEAYFKRSNLKDGQAIAQGLRALERAGKPIYTYPVDFRIREVGQGLALGAVLRTDVQQVFDDDSSAGLLAAVVRVNDAKKFRDQRSTYQGPAENDGPLSPEPVGPAQPPAAPPVVEPAQVITNTNTPARKKLI